MTCREKLKMEHPEYVSAEFVGGCYGCPHEYGYVEKNENVCDDRPSRVRCEECWDREIPGTIKIAELKPIDPHNVFNKMAKKHRACYDSYKCFGFTDEQAFELVRILFEADINK